MLPPRLSAPNGGMSLPVKTPSRRTPDPAEISRHRFNGIRFAFLTATSLLIYGARLVRGSKQARINACLARKALPTGRDVGRGRCELRAVYRARLQGGAVPLRFRRGQD